MELDSLYFLAEGIVLCAQDDAVLVGCDPDRGLYNKKEAAKASQDAQWFLSEIKGRMPLGTLESVWSTILERRDLSPMTMPMFQLDDGPRRCSCCGEPKDETEFPWLHGRGVVSTWCKSCRSKHYEHTIGYAENARCAE